MEGSKIVGVEAKELARIAGRAGLGRAQLVELHRRLLDGLAEASGDTLDMSQRKKLARCVTLLDEDGYFDRALQTAGSVSL